MVRTNVEWVAQVSLLRPGPPTQGLEIALEKLEGLVYRHAANKLRVEPSPHRPHALAPQHTAEITVVKRYGYRA